MLVLCAKIKSSLGGFALPTIMIASLVMLTVLLSSVTSTSSVNTALKAQNYDQLAKNAGDAGLSYAQACLNANNGAAKWTNAKPLGPNTDCSGNQLAGFTCPSTDARCYLSLQGKYKSSFSVGLNQTGSSGTWTKVSGGANHFCAIDSNSKVFCWGSNSDGQLGTKMPVSNTYVPVAVDTSGVLNNKTIVAVAAGNSHSCAIDSTGKAYCWGSNSSGRLGNGTTISSIYPVAVSTAGVLNGKTLTAISAGSSHTCAIDSTGKAYCWGENGSYNLGNNSTVDSYVPVAVDTTGFLSGKTVTMISAGGNSGTCVVASGKAGCWGHNGNGQLGDGTTVQKPVPTAVVDTGVLSGKTVTAISIGQTHACAVASGAAYCWGTDIYGELGNGLNTQSPSPVTVVATGALSGKTVTAISAKDSFSCAVASGAAYCWGDNMYGELGNNSMTESNVPVVVNASGVLSGKTVISSYSSLITNCVLTSENKAYCWGSNGFGELGTNNRSNFGLVPAAVVTDSVLVKDVASVGTVLLTRTSDGSVWRTVSQTTRLDVMVTMVTVQFKVKEISVGDANSCAIDMNDKGYCWGYNEDGQLGDGTVSKKIPSLINTSGALAGKTFRKISSGDAYSCSIMSDFRAYCWGNNVSGRLGNNSIAGSTDEVTPPGPVYTGGVLSGKNIIDISAGDRHACVIADEATDRIYCWGYDSSGNLGNDAAFATQAAPVAVDVSGVLNGKTVTMISAGDSHTCAVASGAAICWGENASGRLGNGLTTDSGVPIQVAGLLSGKTVTSISAGYNHTCALTNEPKVYCWGNGTDGQLGDGLATTSGVPVAVTTTGALSGKTVTAIAAGTNNTCAIASGAVYCWGDGSVGQLGNNSTSTPISAPVAVDVSGVLSGKTIIAIAANRSNGDHACAKDSNNTIYCWGSNSDGQLGNNSTINSLVPVPVFMQIGVNI